MSKFTDGLRDVAQWYDDHPEIEQPEFYAVDHYGLNTKEEAAATMLALKPCHKEYQDSLFLLTREFGSVKLRFLFYRDQVCTKRVVGFREIPEQTLPARKEEIVEWECMPVLGRRQDA